MCVCVFKEKTTQMLVLCWQIKAGSRPHPDTSSNELTEIGEAREFVKIGVDLSRQQKILVFLIEQPGL